MSFEAACLALPARQASCNCNKYIPYQLASFDKGSHGVLIGIYVCEIEERALGCAWFGANFTSDEDGGCGQAIGSERKRFLLSEGVGTMKEGVHIFRCIIYICSRVTFLKVYMVT